METVVVLTFKAVDEARDGFRSLRRLHEAGEVGVEAAAVFERAGDGPSVVVEVSEESHAGGATSAGAIGAVLGLAAGPVGAVMGGATGVFVGSLVDVADVESAEQMLRVLGGDISPGSSATVAVLSESSPAPVDAVASRLGGTVIRRERREVEAKLAEVEQEEIAARRQAASERSIGDRLRDVKEAVRGR